MMGLEGRIPKSGKEIDSVWIESFEMGIFQRSYGMDDVKSLRGSQFSVLSTLLCGFLVCIIFSCSDLETSVSDSEKEVETYPTPPALNDGWNVASLNDVGLHPSSIINMLNEIEHWNSHSFNGILIVKDGKLVFEKYYRGHVFDFNIPGLTNDTVQYGPGIRHFLASQSKSVTSLLFGIAMDKGYIRSVEDSIKTYFAPEYSGLFVGGKELISIKHLLTMSSGLPWYESPPGTNDVMTLFKEADPIDYLLRRPLEAAPGQKFHYNSGGTNLLGEIIYRTTGQNLRNFAGRNLFSPLGITNVDWKSIRGEHVFASGGLFLAPRDLAKIGQLCLNGGVWNGDTIVCKKWLDESTTSWIYPTEFGLGNGYGYQWWMIDFSVQGIKYHSTFAVGWGEQYMFIIPSEKMIVLFFAEYYTRGPKQSVQSLMVNYVLPACLP
jgi:CubicO group peptidase (beta-lactamase class C family)